MSGDDQSIDQASDLQWPQPSGAALMAEATDVAEADHSTEATSTAESIASAEARSTSDATAQQPVLVEDVGPVERAAGPVLEEPAPPPPVDALSPCDLRPVIEALLFVSTRPLSSDRLASCLPGCQVAYLDGFLHGLADRFDHEGRGWALAREANGWRLLTRPAHHPWVRQLERKELPQKLSRGALETLAVIAYRQPVARGVIEDIRGVQCSHVITQLLDLKLVKVAGREEHALGRPWLYGTTDQFLSRFGLGSIDDLPRRHEFGG